MWYTVQSGDSLSILAGRYLGNVMAYMDIFNQNKDILTNPDVVKQGQRIWIPVDGKQNPVTSSSSSSTDYNDTVNPYVSTFDQDTQQTVLQTPAASTPMDMNKMMIYGGAGLAALALLALIV